MNSLQIFCFASFSQSWPLQYGGSSIAFRKMGCMGEGWRGNACIQQKLEFNKEDGEFSHWIWFKSAVAAKLVCVEKKESWKWSFSECERVWLCANLLSLQLDWQSLLHQKFPTDSLKSTLPLQSQPEQQFELVTFETWAKCPPAPQHMSMLVPLLLVAAELGPEASQSTPTPRELWTEPREMAMKNGKMRWNYAVHSCGGI